MNKTVATASMIASLSLGIPPRRRGSPYIDLATKHGTAAALNADAPQVPIVDRIKVEGVEYVAARLAKRIYKRAARKVRMTAKRRRGW